MNDEGCWLWGQNPKLWHNSVSGNQIPRRFAGYLDIYLVVKPEFEVDFLFQIYLITYLYLPELKYSHSSKNL